MKSELRFEEGTFLISRLGGHSSLPAMRGQMLFEKGGELGEDDGLYINYGRLQNILPYSHQDLYGRGLEEAPLPVAVLENDALRATFLPEFGGRLWSLVDKATGRNLLYTNSVIRPSNLALRNAWFSGGVEWNIGMRGHSPMTCERMFTARVTAADGTPVLRMYQYERVRGVCYQMDFFLPEGARLLYARMRIVNRGERVVPMYWWSTIAVDQAEGSRVIVPAEETYVNQGNDPVYREDIPLIGGVDVSYPTNGACACDYFFKIPAQRRKFECQVDREGRGLIQASTARLQGRKLFVWGKGPGGRSWQKFLTNDGRQYTEIQAGLARTQNECLPMPPQTAWEWMEVYGPLEVDPARAHGSWAGAVEAVEEQLDAMAGEGELEGLLRETRQSVALRPGELVCAGSGWGALEELRRAADGEKPLAPHLDFGQPGPEQADWTHLQRFGFLPRHDPAEPPASYMIQPEWTRRLERAAEGPDQANWYTWMHLGIARYAAFELDRARSCFQRSLALAESPWALYGLSNTCRMLGDLEQAGLLALKAATLRPEDPSLAKEACRTLEEAGLYGLLEPLLDALSPEVEGEAMFRYYRASARAHAGDLDGAEAILCAGGGIEIPDIREGEEILSDLWFYIQEERAARTGRTFRRGEVPVPAFLDFRMFARA